MTSFRFVLKGAVVEGTIEAPRELADRLIEVLEMDLAYEAKRAAASLPRQTRVRKPCGCPEHPLRP